MKAYPLQLEISGPLALWSRPDTMPNPVSYVAPAQHHPLRLDSLLRIRWGEGGRRPDEVSAGEWGEGRARCRAWTGIARTFNVVKGIFEAIMRWKSVNVCRKEVGPDYVGPFRDGTAAVRDREPGYPGFSGMQFDEPQSISVN